MLAILFVVIVVVQLYCKLKRRKKANEFFRLSLLDEIERSIKKSICPSAKLASFHLFTV